MKPACTAILLIAVTVLAPVAPVAAQAAGAPLSPPIAGGWSAVDKPAADPAISAAAQALVAQLPGKHPRLRRIESAQSQVVAGTNYRLVVRLTNRTRWSATVWHTLQDTYQVSDIKRLR